MCQRKGTIEFLAVTVYQLLQAEECSNNASPATQAGRMDSTELY